MLNRHFILLFVVILCGVAQPSKSYSQTVCPHELLFVMDGLYFYSAVECPSTFTDDVLVYSKEVATGCSTTSTGCNTNEDYVWKIIINMFAQLNAFNTQETLTEAELNTANDLIRELIRRMNEYSVATTPILAEATFLKIPAHVSKAHEFRVTVKAFGRNRYFRCFKLAFNDGGGTAQEKWFAIECTEPNNTSALGGPMKNGSINSSGYLVVDDSGTDRIFKKFVTEATKR